MTMRDRLAQAIRKDVMAQQKTRGGVIDWGATVDALLAEIVPERWFDFSEEILQEGESAGACGYVVAAEIFRAMIQAIREGK